VARIYVSSTFSDLKECREQVRLALRRLGHEDVAMEYYGATDERPLDKCLNDVASSDLYIGIFALRYGYVPERYDKSITEMEYRKAVETGKECLIFILAHDATWPVDRIEWNAHSRIMEFRKELESSYIVSHFASPADLAARASQAVSNWEKKYQLTRDERAIHSYEQQYRALFAQKYGYIELPISHLSRRKLPLDDLYVAPHIGVGQATAKFISTTEFFSNIKRCVLLGNPGEGKSTFARKICYDLAVRNPATTVHGQSPTPILITLRDYGAAKKNHHYSILDFIIAKANSDFQIKPPDGAFEYLLLSGNALVVFDGLDELLDTGYRQAITEDVQAFSGIYSGVPVLVTSRIVGYEQAPLDPETFQDYRLSPFNNQQIPDYVHKWFTANSHSLVETPTVNVQSFLMELGNISADIKSNPLLLALLCSLYQGEGYIPRNLPLIYEKCATVLFEKRDQERGIKFDAPLEAALSPMLMFLANWIYGNNTLESGVPEQSLISQAVDYLMKGRFEDRDEAEQVAKRFIEFCTGRAWVFTDTGTTKNGERLYQFTHRTFLEYFTAMYWVRIYPTPERLFEHIIPQIAQAEATLVGLLAYQQMARQVEGASDELLNLLLKSIKQFSAAKATNIVEFAILCLQFITPKPSLVQSIIAQSVDLVIQRAIAYFHPINMDEVYRNHRYFEDRRFIFKLLSGLELISPDNRVSLVQSLEQHLIKRIHDHDENASLIAVELSLHLDAGLRSADTPQNRELLELLQEVSKRIVKQCKSHIFTNLCPKYFMPCIELFFCGEMSLREIVNFHGTDCLFRQYRYPVISWLYAPEIVVDIQESACDYWHKDNLEDTRDKIKELGEVLLATPLPWITFEDGDLDNIEIKMSCTKPIPNLDSKILFGVFTALAFQHERWYEADYGGHLLKASELEMPYSDYFLPLFIQRTELEQVDKQVIFQALDKCGFEGKEREFVKHWTYRELSVTSW
jgi:hypothetical protein